MKSSISNRLLLFAAAISAGYLLMETFRPLLKMREAAVSEGSAAPIGLGTESTMPVPPRINDDGLTHLPKQPPPPLSPEEREKLIKDISPEEFLAMQKEQLEAMKKSLAENPQSDQGVTQADLDKMAAEGRMAW